MCTGYPCLRNTCVLDIHVWGIPLYWISMFLNTFVLDIFASEYLCTGYPCLWIHLLWIPMFRNTFILDIHVQEYLCTKYPCLRNNFVLDICMFKEYLCTRYPSLRNTSVLDIHVFFKLIYFLSFVLKQIC